MATKSFSKKEYTGPLSKRRVVDGKADVSKEELDDFRRKFGKDKTLRDLLNADRAKKAPEASKKEAPKATPSEAKKEAPKPVKAAPRREPADIPVGKEKAPKRTGETTAGPSEVEKMLMGLPMVGGAAALGVGAMRAKRAAAASKAAAKEFTKPKAAATTANTGRRFTDKEEMEAATSAARGAASRKDIQAKRAERQKLQEEYERMLDKYSKQKSSPRDRTREKAEFEFAKGGMAKKGKK